MSEFHLVEVKRFSSDLAHHFESLNREWIEKYFIIEEADRVVFADPFKQIVEPGGEIFFVVADRSVAGTCAVIKISDHVFELAKMAVSAIARGRGYGDLLIKNAIDFAREAGAEKILLLSNTRLKPAIALYEKYGFKSVPITDAHDYKRVDIQMELELK